MIKAIFLLLFDALNITDDGRLHDSELKSSLVNAFLKAEQGRFVALTRGVLCYPPTSTMLPTIITIDETKFGQKYYRSSLRAQHEIQQQTTKNAEHYTNITGI